MEAKQPELSTREQAYFQHRQAAKEQGVSPKDYVAPRTRSWMRAPYAPFGSTSSATASCFSSGSTRGCAHEPSAERGGRRIRLGVGLYWIEDSAK